jgi:hypothetical protein
MQTNGTTVCAEPGGVGLERARFFARQLVGPDDLTQDQVYFAEKLRRHNRLLHGWGVVCGARVRAGEGCEVVVEPGYVLGPRGHEILIPHEVPVDLCREDVNGDAVSPCAAADPWCADVRVTREPDRPLYVAVRYEECRTRPVRVATSACGCDDAECEYSRTRDSFAIRVLEELPASYRPMPPASRAATMSCVGGVPPLCPPCPDDPWVILADVTLSGSAVATIDCRSHRRHVASFGAFWFGCGPQRAPGREVLGEPVRFIDLSAGERGRTLALVGVRREGGGWAEVGARLDVREDDTFATLVAREGDRQLEDPVSGETVSIAELYAVAGVDPAQPVRSESEALAPLEGILLRVGDLRVVRARIDELVDDRAARRLDRELGGSPSAALDLPATSLRGVSAQSIVGGALESATIAEVAGEGRDAFVSRVARDAPEARRAGVERQAAEVWTRARRVASLGRAWAEGAEPM